MDAFVRQKGKKMLTHWGWETLMGIRGFACDDSTHDLCRYRSLLWPWELPHFVLMFGLTGDCGSLKSHRVFFIYIYIFYFDLTHFICACSRIVINIHLSSCGFFRDIKHWWWIEVLILLWTHLPWKLFFLIFDRCADFWSFKYQNFLKWTIYAYRWSISAYFSYFSIHSKSHFGSVFMLFICFSNPSINERFLKTLF